MKFVSLGAWFGAAACFSYLNAFASLIQLTKPGPVPGFLFLLATASSASLPLSVFLSPCEIKSPMELTLILP